MKYRLSAALLLAVVIPAAALRGQEAPKDLDKLQGTWVLTAMEKNGNAAPEYVLGKLTVTFKGDTMVMAGPLAAAKGKEPVKPEFTVKLDQSKKPKAIDATPLSGNFKGKTVLGIYQLEGEELKICLPKQGDKGRPSAFKSPEGSDLAFMTFKRSPPAKAAEKTVMPDLKALADGKGGTIPAGVTLKWIGDAKGKPALKVQSKKDDAVILLDRIELTNGAIEFDALGQSGPPGSNFLGVAFRVVDAKTHDAIYFRPFNFRAEEAERKAHAVQYVSHPTYRWQVLRTDKPGQYEKPIVPAPDGDGWFHVRIVVEKPKVSAYVNDGKEPSLVVEELSDRKGGGVGLWVGPGQGGYLANLKITPSQ